MNIMTDTWTVFARDAGQIVERSYRYDPDSEMIWRMTHDRSDGTTSYACAVPPMDDDDAWCWEGGEADAPFAELAWRERDGHPFA